MRLSKAHCQEMNLQCRRKSGDTLHGKVESGDHLRRHVWSEGDHVWHHGWSGETMYGVMDGPGVLEWRKGTIHGTVEGPRTIHGAVYGPAGPPVGGSYMAGQT